MGEIALGELGLDIYPNQIEVITAEQMLDAYSSIGMPLMYRHWSFGKRFAHDEAYYKRGMRTLAYELVINSDPCISYVMEENSMTMQALVLAHAAYGPQPLLQEQLPVPACGPSRTTSSTTWPSPRPTWPSARSATATRRSKAVLDAAHALMNQGVSRDFRPRPRNVAKREQERAARRRAYEEATYDDIYRTLPEITREGTIEPSEAQGRAAAARAARGEPALLPREERAQARRLAARAAAHRAAAVAVLLSAAPDQDDERGLRHLRALRDHEPPVRAGPADRRHHARVPALALVGHLPAGASTIAASAASTRTRWALP